MIEKAPKYCDSPRTLGSPSSSGLGHRPLTPKTGVRLPLGIPIKSIGWHINWLPKGCFIYYISTKYRGILGYNRGKSGYGFVPANARKGAIAKVLLPSLVLCLVHFVLQSLRRFKHHHITRRDWCLNAGLRITANALWFVTN